MSKRIDVYNADSYTNEESEREYEEIGSVTFEREQDYGFSYIKSVTPLYLDPLTGLVVADIAAYEKWVR